MAKALRESRDDALYREMVELKRHYRTCRKCGLSKKTNDPYDMCPTGLRLSWLLGRRLDDLIELRRKALGSKTSHIFACPDLSKHGKSYALTALPMAVQGIQDRIF
jgi:hypothetical protein